MVFENKKLMWIIGGGIVVVLLLVFVIAWKLGNKNKTILPAGLTEVVATTNRPLGLTVNDKGETFYFDGVKKQFFKNNEAISDKLDITFKNSVAGIKWSDDFNAAIIKTMDSVYLYDFKNQKLITLNSEVKDADFLANNQLVNVVHNQAMNYLTKSNFDGTGVLQIVTLNFYAPNIIVSHNKKIAIVVSGYSYQPIDLTTGKLGKEVNDQVKELHFANDDRYFAYYSGKGILKTIEIATGKTDSLKTPINNFTWANRNQIVGLTNQPTSQVVSYTVFSKPNFTVLAKTKTYETLYGPAFSGNKIYLANSKAIFNLELQ